MSVNRVHTIAEADADGPHHARINRLKYTHAAEMLAEYRASNAMIGRTLCPVCDYLSANLDKDVIELERTIYTHPDWGPSVLIETIMNTPIFNPPATEHGRFICAAVQHCAALALVEHPWSLARPYIEHLLSHEKTAFIGAEAKDVLVAHIRANHRRADEFLAQPHIAAKLSAPN